jgi:hypothetical protein
LIFAPKLPSKSFGMKGKTEKLKFTILILLLFMIVGNILSAQTKTSVNNDSIKINFTQKYISVSPLLSPRICLGIITARQNKEQHWIEYNYYLHGFYSIGLKTYGATVTYNYFWSETRKGYFTQLTAGIDYVYFNGLVPYSDDAIDGFTTNLSGGFGYSFQLGEESYLRLAMDIGMKWFLSNIYISYVW